MRLAAAAFAALAVSYGCGSVTGPAAPPLPSPSPTPAVARYEVVFDANWHETTHAVPPNPHFSRLIGGTHDARVSFWAEGAIASEGMKRMAEIGAQAPLDEEVLAAVAAGTAQHLLAGREQPANPGATRLEFEVGRDHPLVTL